jgi:hypothetical protein
MAVKTVTMENIPMVTPNSDKKVLNLSPFNDPKANLMLSTISLKIIWILL